MAKKLYEEASVQAIANAIREKNSEASTYKIGEMAAAIEAIKLGKLECEAMPHEETLRVMRIMDGLRKEWGVNYPEEVL